MTPRANEARRDDFDFVEQVRMEHRAIVSAIDQHDAAMTDHAARTHMQHAAERLKDAQ